MQHKGRCFEKGLRRALCLPIISIDVNVTVGYAIQYGGNEVTDNALWEQNQNQLSKFISTVFPALFHTWLMCSWFLYGNPYMKALHLTSVFLFPIPHDLFVLLITLVESSQSDSSALHAAEESFVFNFSFNSRKTFRMAPPPFYSFLQKGISHLSHWGKLVVIATSKLD